MLARATSEAPRGAQTSADVCTAISRHLAVGAPWDACDLYRAHSGQWGQDAAFLYWGAMAHVRAGSGYVAYDLLDRAQSAAQADDMPLQEKILSLRGRLWKDRVEEGGDEASAFAAQAFANYHAAYSLRQDPFPGINAASMALLMGDPQRSRRLARAVAAQLSRQSTAPGQTQDVWHLASLGEAALLQGRANAARKAYAAAQAAAPQDVGSLASMRRQLRLLAPLLPLANELLPLLPAPPVMAFAGHMIDRPDRAAPRFPATLQVAVREALQSQLQTLQWPIIYTSAACGADLILIEAALARGAEVNVVLPFDRQDFIATSVAPAGGDWVARFDAALSRVHRVIMATDEGFLGDDVLFEHAARLVEGLAVLRARQFSSAPQLLCVLDGDADEGSGHVDAPVGGTRASIRRWREQLATPTVINLRSLRAEKTSDLGAAVAAAQPRNAELVGIANNTKLTETKVSHQAMEPARSLPSQPLTTSLRSLKTLVFADFAGYGRLHDVHAPLFHARFLDIVAACIAAAPVAPLEANTWGDALYVVFDAAEQGADFAWHLLQRMRAVDWVSAGLSSESQIRIALHTGPVFCGYDPVIKANNYYGRSVTKAARIEPITAPGAIYVSEDFAATLASSGRRDYRLEYMGEQMLAKSYGPTRVYRLHRPADKA